MIDIRTDFGGNGTGRRKMSDILQKKRTPGEIRQCRTLASLLKDQQEKGFNPFACPLGGCEKMDGKERGGKGGYMCDQGVCAKKAKNQFIP